MKKDFYTDSIMGEWKQDKRKTTKDNLCYKREATIKLHKDHAMAYTDPEDFKDYKVFGDVTLTEQKLVNTNTSAQTFFRGLKLTPTSEKVAVIK